MKSYLSFLKLYKSFSLRGREKNIIFNIWGSNSVFTLQNGPTNFKKHLSENDIFACGQLKTRSILNINLKFKRSRCSTFSVCPLFVILKKKTDKSFLNIKVNGCIRNNAKNILF